MDENALYGRMQDAEARNNTLRQEMERFRDRWRNFKTEYGFTERDGVLDVNYDVFVEKLGVENWIELRKIGDARYNVNGAPGEKPRVKVRAA